ncbi:hypothetical protein ABK040_001697 [Willaertia magna]
MSIRVGERGIDDFEDNEVFIEGEEENKEVKVTIAPVNPVTPVTPVVNPPNDSTVIIAVVVPIGSVLILFFIVFTTALVFVCLRKPNYTEPIVHQQATELREKQSGVVMYSSKNIEAQQQFGFDGDVAYRK